MTEGEREGEGEGGKRHIRIAGGFSRVMMEVRLGGMNGTGGRPFVLRRNLIQHLIPIYVSSSCHYNYRTPETIT